MRAQKVNKFIAATSIYITAKKRKKEKECDEKTTATIRLMMIIK